MITSNSRTSESDPARLLQGRGSILVVDDEPTVLNVLIMALEKSGFCVIAANNGTEALAKFATMKDKIRVVITYMAMPGMNGLDLIHSIQKFGTEVDFVLTSGLTTPDQMTGVRDAGVRHVLSKPYGLRQILELMRDLYSTP
jgi:two-component system, cell cycle sensor histidine kinase and response regulator CckA